MRAVNARVLIAEARQRHNETGQTDDGVEDRRNASGKKVTPRPFAMLWISDLSSDLICAHVYKPYTDAHAKLPCQHQMHTQMYTQIHTQMHTQMHSQIHTQHCYVGCVACAHTATHL